MMLVYNHLRTTFWYFLTFQVVCIYSFFLERVVLKIIFFLGKLTTKKPIVETLRLHKNSRYCFRYIKQLIKSRRPFI